MKWERHWENYLHRSSIHAMPSPIKISKPTGCWKRKWTWLTASPDAGGQKFRMRCIFQISFYNSAWFTFMDVFVKCFLMVYGTQRSKVTSVQSDIKFFHLYSRGHDVIILKIIFVWAAVTRHFDRYFPSLGVYLKERLFSSIWSGSHEQREGAEDCQTGNVICLFSQKCN